MSSEIQSKSALFATLPPPYPVDLRSAIGAQVRADRRKLIVLDDDPTGTQTVYDVPVLTQWTVDQLVAELRDPAPLLYILTNTRSLPADQAIGRIESIMVNLRTACDQVPRPISVIDRGDSTLRGHFPAEVDAIARGLSIAPDGIVIAPCFFEGGRYTIDDTHFIAEGDRLIPVAETEYARDHTFGYRSSNLRDWLIEKYGEQAGDLPADRITSMSVADLRQGGPAWVADRLQQVHGGAYVIVNAVDYRDLDVFIAGLLHAEQTGKTFLARTAASYVQARAGLLPRGLLTGTELQRGTAPGLIVAGSYIARSSGQIAQALELPNIGRVEVAVEALLNDSTRHATITHAIDAITQHWHAGQDALLFTSRIVITGASTADHLRIGAIVSHALVAIVAGLRDRPGWLIAKGGITSSDIATQAIGIQRAIVLGQLIAGVPVWRAGAESRWLGLTYVIFPGNVGDVSALADAIISLRGAVPLTINTP